MLSLSAVAVGGSGQDKPPTPAEQYQALRKEYDRAPGSFPQTDAERQKFVGNIYKHHFEVAPKFLELAEKYPNDPIALDALTQAVWQVNTTPWPVELVGEDTARAKVAAKNPHKGVQATATLSLARFLNNRLGRIELCRKQAGLAKQFGALYGKEYIADLMRQDGEKVIKQVEAVFEQAAEKYGDVELPGGDMVAERAKAELFEIRNLRVGKQAPGIESFDQDGKRFKLSDYRGKVLLLDFWSFV